MSHSIIALVNAVLHACCVVDDLRDLSRVFDDGSAVRLHAVEQLPKRLGSFFNVYLVGVCAGRVKCRVGKRGVVSGGSQEGLRFSSLLFVPYLLDPS